MQYLTGDKQESSAPYMQLTFLSELFFSFLIIFLYFAQIIRVGGYIN